MKRAFIILLKILAGLLVFLLIACRLADSRWKGEGAPHYKVAQTVKDFMDGIDTQLEFALDLIQKGRF